MKKIFYASIILTVIVDFFFVKKSDVHFFLEKVPGFYAIFGFAAVIIIIFLAKILGKAFLLRNEDYYD